MAKFNEIMRASDAIIDAIFTAYADDIDDDGDAVITDSDMIDDFIEIIEIIARMDSRKWNASRAPESIL